MQLLVRDPEYTDRLAGFLRSLGQAAYVRDPRSVEVSTQDLEDTREDLLVYLRVWNAIYPDADVELRS